MNPERVDQVLRRASDDVHATIVRHTVPPPIEILTGDRHPIGRSLLGVAAVTVAVAVGLAIVADTTRSVHTPIDAPGPVSTVGLEVPPASTSTDDLCVRVVRIAEVLVDPPGEITTWVALGDQLDDLAAGVAQAGPTIDDDTTRRYDRFLALAGQAVSLGAAGGFTPAAVRADDAVAVADDLVQFVAVPGCELRRPPTDDEPRTDEPRTDEEKPGS